MNTTELVNLTMYLPEEINRNDQTHIVTSFGHTSITLHYTVSCIEKFAKWSQAFAMPLNLYEGSITGIHEAPKQLCMCA